MAILHADNFSHYGGDKWKMLEGVYANIAGAFVLTNDPDGVSSGKVIQSGGELFFRQVVNYVLQNGPVSKCGIAMRYWASVLPSGYQDRAPYPIFMNDEANNNVLKVRLNPTGTLTVQIAGGATVTTPAPVMTAQGWYHLELLYASTGAGLADIELRVEGVPVLLIENTAVGINYPAMAGFATQADTTELHYYKDMVVYDGNGEDNNDFLGTVIVHSMAPTSDVQTGWSPVGGTDATDIFTDATVPNNAQYMDAPYSGTEPHYPDPIILEIGDLPEDATSVKALVTYVRAKKTDGGDGGLQTSLVSDGATVDGANRPITVGHIYWRDVFERDPATSAPFTPDAANAVRMKINRTA